MSRTMKPEEAIMALAFVANPEELTTVDVPMEPHIRDESFGPGIGGSITRSLSKILSSKRLDLYAKIGDNDVTETVLEGEETLKSKRRLMKQKSAPGLSRENDKEVCFGTVEVRKYPITIGQNPSVSRGVPHTIEWDYIKGATQKKTINAYERDRPNEERKHGDDLVIDAITRAKMLKNVGYTKPQLMEGLRKVNEVKTRRKSDTHISRVSSSYKGGGYA